MRDLTLSAALFAGLAGCATTGIEPGYGSFLTNAAPMTEKKAAADAAKRLEGIYPPALTKFDLRHATLDGFGTALVRELRVRGYALHEFSTRGAADKEKASGEPNRESASLAYVVDQPLDASAYRITMVIGQQSLSRLYRTHDGRVFPAGDWVWKE